MGICLFIKLVVTLGSMVAAGYLGRFAGPLGLLVGLISGGTIGWFLLGSYLLFFC